MSYSSHIRMLCEAIAVLVLVCPGCHRIEESRQNDYIAAGASYYEEMKEEMSSSDSSLYTREDIYYAERLSHARRVEATDFETRKESLPQELYTYGVNYGLLPEESHDLFKTNTETITTISEADLQNFLECVSGFISTYYTFDYRKGLQTIADDLSYYLSPINATKYALNSDIQYNLNKQLISDCRFLTDSSLVYIDAAGNYRIRGRMFTYVEYIHSAGTLNYNMNPGKWYYHDVELAFIKDTTPGEWDHANFCFTLYYNMTGTHEVSQTDIEKYLL